MLFGVTGDLARKKLMPAIYDLANRGLLPPGFSLVGFARRDWADQDFGKIVYDVGARARPHAVPRGGLAHARRGHPVRAGHLRRRRRLRPARRRPSTSSTSSAAPAATTPSTCRSRRRRSPRSASSSSAPASPTPQPAVVAPGRHREAVRPRPASRRASSTTSSSDVFPADSVFRIDHYLGKETVQNLLALRFANQLFEPVWNANYVDHVQITMAEDIGIGGRAGYYDGIGAARDVIQNHLLQLLALTAMEEPVSFDAAGPARREGEGALGGPAARRPRRRHRPRPVRRRLAGRRGGRRLPRGGRRRHRRRPPRRTPRCALDVDTRRWAGVPFYLRTGKRLGKRVTEIAVVFKRAPHLPFEHDRHRGARPERRSSSGCSPTRASRCGSARRCPGAQMEVRDVTMDFGYGRAFTESSPEAYERLILDVLLGDPPLFPRHEEVELSWQILDPIEAFWAKQGKPEQYAAGGWGPASRRRDDARATAATWRLP